MSLQVPFEARAIQDFPVHPVEVGIEYTVVDVSEDGSRFAARLPDGSLGWFPSKLVRVIDNRGPQRAQQTTSYNTTKSPAYQTNTQNAYETNSQREHEAAKRAAAEKERRRAELQKKLKQQQQTQTVRRVDNVDDDEVEEATRKLERMKTYTETRGYLSNAPGFSKDLSKYIEDDEPEPEPEPEPVQITPKATHTNTTGVYRKIDERPDGPKYVPSDDLPPQYKNTPWKCHSCHTNNGADRTKCNMCGTLRGEMSLDVENANSVPGEDWKCSSCKVSNAPARSTCVMCGTKYKPTSTQTTAKAKDPNKDKKTTPVGNVKKKNIVSKAGSGVELQYAKGVDNYKTGGVIPGHGAGY